MSAVALDATADSDAITWSGIAVTYPGPPPVQALRATDLRIEPGDYVAVTGPSGSGKSTLLNVLGLLDRPTAGTYRIGPHDVAAMDDRRRAALRAHSFGFVFQRFHLVPWRSAVENVELGLLYAGVGRGERRQRALDALERVGLAARAQHAPAALSGGEQQRVAIARAVARAPRFVLADEPTGSLDSGTTREILALLESLVAEGITVVCVTHNAEVAGRAHRRLSLLDGVVST